MTAKTVSPCFTKVSISHDVCAVLIHAQGFCHICYLRWQWASLLNYELCAKHAHLYKSPWSHLHQPTASEIVVISLLRSYHLCGKLSWPHPARSFPTWHHFSVTVSFPGNVKRNWILPTLQKTSEVLSLCNIFKFEFHCFKNKFVMASGQKKQSTIKSTPSHQPGRGEILHSAPSQSEPGTKISRFWKMSVTLTGHLQRAACEITNHSIGFKHLNQESMISNEPCVFMLWEACFKSWLRQEHLIEICTFNFLARFVRFLFSKGTPYHSDTANVAPPGSSWMRKHKAKLTLTLK